MKSGEKCRLVCRYAIMPFQFRFIHETNKLKKYFTYKDKQNHLRRSSIVYKLTCTWVKLHWTDSPKFNNPNQRTQIWSTFWSLQTSVGQSHHRFNFKQLEILGSIVGQKKLHLLESLPIQQHQSDLNVDVHPSPYCFLKYNGLYDAIRYECLEIGSLFFL